MVMPDRIRWIYRDPQGNTQGPWSGLEMHDWYRAGFFSPELLVKKVEDADYEPLAQLIRRIGNSREPFLVPQIGIPGPPTSQSGNWPSQSLPALTSPVAPAVQPPFAGSFPSFGTTLTAEQQNALEQRKQEEQYLMARQKEHLAQQQMLMKLQTQSGQGLRQQPLQHQQSTQSLNSQPSFGNIATPGGFQSSPLQGLSQTGPGVAATLEQAFTTGAVGSGPEDLSRKLDKMSLDQDIGHNTFPERAHYGELEDENQRIESMLRDRAMLAHEQAEENRLGDLSNETEFLTNQRLQEFRNLRQQFESEALSQSDMHDLDSEHYNQGTSQGELSLPQTDMSQVIQPDAQGSFKR